MGGCAKAPVSEEKELILLSRVDRTDTLFAMVTPWGFVWHTCVTADGCACATLANSSSCSP